MTNHAIDVNEIDFEQQVLTRSCEIPVLVDFWAPWCAPCKSLKPLLEKLAAEYGGRFLLAKVNSDENQNLAGRFNVRGIPDVRAFVDGEIVDGFTGLISEADLRQFLSRLIPSESEKLRRAAGQQPDLQAASQLLKDAIALDQLNVRAWLDLAEIELEQGQIDSAAQIVERMAKDSSLAPKVEQIRAKIAFRRNSGAAPSPEELEQRIETNPDDLDSRMLLANLYAANGSYEAALSMLLEVVKRDRSYQDDAARKMMLAVFDLASSQPELVSRYRRQLASALH